MAENLKELHIDANFPGGAVEGVRIKENGSIYFQAPKNGSPRSLWYYFRVRGGKGIRLNFFQEGLEDVLGVKESRGYSFTNPVIREGDNGEWKRLPEDDVHFSQDTLQYTFCIQPKTDCTFVAFSFPYTANDLKDFFGLHKNSKYLRWIHIGRTKEGRDFPCIIAGKGQVRGKNIILITARHHAGEVSGSYVLEGLISSFLGSIDNDDPLWRDIVLLIFPIVDLDSVETGRYGKDRPPVDFNRDWTADPEHREVRLVKECTEEYLRQNTLLLYIDLHAPQPGGTTYIVPPRLRAYKEKTYEKIERFVAYFENRIEEISTCRAGDLDPDAINWGREMYQYGSTYYHASHYQVPSFTLETSYHYDSNNLLLTPPVWRSIGRELTHSIGEVFIRGASGLPENNRSPFSREILWKNWEMVATPENMELTEKGTAMIFSLSGKNGKAFITYRAFLKKGSNTSVVFEVLEELESCEVEIITYFYKNGTVYSHRNSDYVILQSGIVTFNPTLFHHPGDFTHFRFSFKVRGKSGLLSVGING